MTADMGFSLVLKKLTRARLKPVAQVVERGLSGFRTLASSVECPSRNEGLGGKPARSGARRPPDPETASTSRAS
jgi:hypothetical protein